MTQPLRSTSLPGMIFGRKRSSRDPFEQLKADRRAIEDETPWFLAEDDDAEQLEIEAGRSARMGDDQRARDTDDPRR